MSPARRAFAQIAELIEQARNLDHSGAPPASVLSANLKRHEAEEIAREFAFMKDEDVAA